MKYNHHINQIRPLEWNIVEVTELQQVDNKFTHAVYFWLDNIVARFITEFVVDTAKYYKTTKKEFLKGPRGRYI